MKSYSPRLEVSFDTYRIPRQGDRVTREVELRNVMAVLPGRTPRRFYVSGHYDTVARPVPARGVPVTSPCARGAGRAERQRRVRLVGGRQPRAGRERRRQRDRAHHGARARLRPERPRLRRHARLHLLRGRGAGAGGGQAARAARRRRRSSPSTGVLNNDIVGNGDGRPGGEGHRKPSACSRRDRRTRPPGSSRAPSAAVPPSTCPRTASASSRATTASAAAAITAPSTRTATPACASPRARRTTRASTPWTTRSREASIPSTWPGTRA